MLEKMPITLFNEIQNMPGFNQQPVLRGSTSSVRIHRRVQAFAA